jgi:hypothetical protein
MGRVVSPPPNPQVGGPPTVGCPRLLIQYIHTYPPYLEAVSSIRNPRTCHAVVTVDPLNMEFKIYTVIICTFCIVKKKIDINIFNIRK